MKFKTEQEQFWNGSFGDNYISRNESQEQLASNINFFSNIFKNVNKPKSVIEFGPNIGLNLRAIKLLCPNIDLSGVEINLNAVESLKTFMDNKNIFHESILDFKPSKQYDLSLIKTVLIHINPSYLNNVYEKLYNSSKKYILICEYYNPSPVTINYRGHDERLFKRDFAGEMMDKYDDLKLIDYGFRYKRDNNFSLDDITWFLLSK
ncbi:hypothetical protein OAQ20_01020 [Flavobacteriaceae bacterium]|nr:hypothetical protein [Flavobacteriaceae bacterium]